jgi:hypothetical protein
MLRFQQGARAGGQQRLQHPKSAHEGRSYCIAVGHIPRSKQLVRCGGRLRTQLEQEPNVQIETELQLQRVPGSKPV